MSNETQHMFHSCFQQLPSTMNHMMKKKKLHVSSRIKKKNDNDDDTIDFCTVASDNNP